MYGHLLQTPPVEFHHLFYTRKVLVLFLHRENVRCAQSCVSAWQNLREYLSYLQLLVEFDTLTYRKGYNWSPTLCGLSLTAMELRERASQRRRLGQRRCSMWTFVYFCAWPLRNIKDNCPTLACSMFLNLSHMCSLIFSRYVKMS